MEVLDQSLRLCISRTVGRGICNFSIFLILFISFYPVFFIILSHLILCLHVVFQNVYYYCFVHLYFNFHKGCCIIQLIPFSASSLSTNIFKICPYCHANFKSLASNCSTRHASSTFYLLPPSS